MAKLLLMFSCDQGLQTKRELEFGMWGRMGLVLLATIGAALLSAACGGGGSSSDAGDGGPTKAAFLNRANAICDSAVQARSDALERTTKKLISAGGAPVPVEQKELVTMAIVPTEKAMVAELSELTPPADDSELIGEIVEGLEEGIERIEAEPAIAFKPVAVTPADVLAEKYGLPECRV